MIAVYDKFNCKRMKLKIIHLEDSVMKHIAISRVIGKMAQVDWVTDMASGIEKIDFSHYALNKLSQAGYYSSD